MDEGMFAYLGVLREAIGHRLSGSVRFQGPFNQSCRIPLCNGRLAASAMMEHMKYFFSGDAHHVHWHSERLCRESHLDISVHVCECLDEIEWPERKLRALRLMFSRFSAVTIGIAAGRFHDISTMICYNEFYRKTKEAPFTPHQLMSQAESTEALQACLRVLVMTYALGIMRDRARERQCLIPSVSSPSTNRSAALLR